MRRHVVLAAALLAISGATFSFNGSAGAETELLTQQWVPAEAA